MSYAQKGKLLDHTPASAVAAGGVVVIGDIVAVAPRPIAASALGAIAVDGVFALPVSTTGVTGAQGSVIRWYATSGVAHATTGVVAGVLAKDRAAADMTVDVLLNVPGPAGPAGPTGA
jgi:predicted RecA/RadA family phage recombinase